MNEPLIHSHITDVLPDGHKLEGENVFCVRCNAFLHACYNECMQTWVKTGLRNFCLKCLCAETDGALEDEYGLNL